MRAGESPAARHLADALARVAAADLASLGRSWRRAFGQTAPPGLTRGMLVRVLSYRLQAEALGDLDRNTARALDRMAGQSGTAAMPLPDERGAQAGTVLLREWRGVMQTVMVMTDGYAWGGTSYRSLSEVARAITGTRWNGPRFFGLRARPRTAQRKQGRSGGSRSDERRAA